ncbi:hypothetical protein [Haloparvum sp. PAK95]|uniref:hypothetical protein n=1 Tax=Haloparvum sp. PAK95 TaxID=3418962 RepID=UPI003D2EE6D6
MSVQTDPLSDSIDALNGSRYDWLLVAIPVPLILGLAVSATLPVATEVGLGLGAVPAALLVCYALFVDAPVVDAPVVGSGTPADVELESRPDDGAFDVDPESQPGDPESSTAGVDGTVDSAVEKTVDSFGGSTGGPRSGSVPGSDD